MIRAEIRFKNSAFWSALEKGGYKSMAEFSRKANIRYDKLLAYANLRYIFENDRDTRQVMMALLQSDEWTLFDQYEKVIRKEGGVKKIVTDIPIDKMVSLENRSVLMLESPYGVDESMVKESLEEEVAAVLDTLKDRERDVIRMYFGIGQYRPMDLNEIAEKFGLSRERTRQIKEKAIRRLRHRSRTYTLAGYIGHRKLKRLKVEREEEYERREKYMNDNNLSFGEMSQLEGTRPWNDDTPSNPWDRRKKNERVLQIIKEKGETNGTV